MERLTITTHLIAIITAFSAFTMPIALEVLNRVKNRYGSTHYMVTLEEIIGFRIVQLFRELIFTLILLIGFTFIVGSIEKTIITKNQITIIENLLFLICAALLCKEFIFIKTVFAATRSDDLITDYLISSLSKNSIINHSENIDLLVQIACYNIEKSAIDIEYSTESRIFRLVSNKESHIKTEILKLLIQRLASTLSSARNSNSRDKYVSIQRTYGRLLILFFDDRINETNIFDNFSYFLYEESIREFGSGMHWLLNADFLINVGIHEIKKPATIHFIDHHIKLLIDFLKEKDPTLIPELIDNYRSFISHDDHFGSEIYNITTFYKGGLSKHLDAINELSNNYKQVLLKNPEQCINKFILLFDLCIQEAISEITSQCEFDEIRIAAKEYESEMITQLITGLGAYEARKTAQYALRVLSHKSEWHNLLACFEQFSPAHARGIRIDINLLPITFNTVLQQLEEQNSYNSFQHEELKLAYAKATPILIMYITYAWRIRNINKSIDFCVKHIITELSLENRTIKNCKFVIEELEKAIYYAKSKSYSVSFCRYFSIEHDSDFFHRAVTPILLSMQKFLSDEINYLLKNQPLSEKIIASFKNIALGTNVDIFSKYPLFRDAKFINTNNDTTCKVFQKSYPREVFLDNTGTSYCLLSRDILSRIHSDIAIKLIQRNGINLHYLSVTDISAQETLFITTKDWMNHQAINNATNVMKNNIFLIPSSTAFNAFYIHNSATCNVIRIEKSNAEIVESIQPEHIRDAFIFNFTENDGFVSVTILSNLYY